MIAALDVDYRSDHAIAACVVFRDWADGVAASEHTARVAPLEPYVPGQFFRRELPCLLAVLQKVPDPLDAIVIDGYVTLNALPDGTIHPGLGTHLFEVLHKKVPVIGVAKTAFAGAAAEEVLRPGSARPLYVTAAGMERPQAAAHVLSMHGDHRLPTMLKRVDSLARSAI